MLLADVVADLHRGRIDTLAQGQGRGVRRRCSHRSRRRAEEIETVTSYLAGSLRQRRTGLGWRSMQSCPPPAAEPSLTVPEVHQAFERIAALAGSGSQAARAAATAELFGRATAEEQPWLRGIVTGEVRQGALDSLVQEGLAAAGGVPLKAVRRAAMMAGSTVTVAAAALTGGEEALAGSCSRSAGRCCRCSPPARPPSRRRWRRPVRPGSPVVDRHQARRHPDPGPPVGRRGDRGDAVARGHHRPAARGRRGRPGAAGVAVRPRRRGAGPRRGRAAAAVPGDRVAHRDDRGRPPHALLLRPPPPRRHRPASTPPAPSGWPRSTRLVPEAHRIARLETDDPEAAEAFVADVLARGHEGVVVKNLAAHLRRRSPRLRLGEGQAGPHPRPRRARRRVGLRPPPRLALQHPPRRPRHRSRVAS